VGFEEVRWHAPETSGDAVDVFEQTVGAKEGFDGVGGVVADDGRTPAGPVSGSEGVGGAGSGHSRGDRGDLGVLAGVVDQAGELGITQLLDLAQREQRVPLDGDQGLRDLTVVAGLDQSPEVVGDSAGRVAGEDISDRAVEVEQQAAGGAEDVGQGPLT
jgi:hypothetical protein